MERLKLPKIVYTCFLSIPMILIIYFFLPFLVSKHHKLVSSTYELITVAKSSRVAVFAVFAVFNVIVITIFRGSSNPSVADFEEVFLSSPSVYEAYSEEEREYNEGYDSSDREECDEPHGYDGYGGDDDLDQEDVDSEDESDTDLKMRIKEFITSSEKEKEYNKGYGSSAEDEECDEPHGHHGYDDLDQEDEGDPDLKTRIEEFIANTYKIWREESLAERLLCLGHQVD